MTAAAHPIALPHRRTGRRLPLPRLVYTQPAWKRSLIQPFRAPRPPRVTWKGNVAHVAWKPLGFCIVEIEPDEWALAWQRAGSKPEPFTDRGVHRDVAQYHLADLWLQESRPLYPPVPLGANDLRPAPRSHDINGGAA